MNEIKSIISTKCIQELGTFLHVVLAVNLAKSCFVLFNTMKTSFWDVRRPSQKFLGSQKGEN